MSVHCTTYNGEMMTNWNWEYLLGRIVYVSYNVRRTLYAVQCTLYNVQYALYTVQCTPYTVRRTMYTVQCTPCNVRRKGHVRLTVIYLRVSY